MSDFLHHIQNKSKEMSLKFEENFKEQERIKLANREKVFNHLVELVKKDMENFVSVPNTAKELEFRFTFTYAPIIEGYPYLNIMDNKMISEIATLLSEKMGFVTFHAWDRKTDILSLYVTWDEIEIEYKKLGYSKYSIPYACPIIEYK